VQSLTIKLRSGLKFHSGALLMADDVVASLQRHAQSRPECQRCVSFCARERSGIGIPRCSKKVPSL